MFEQDSYIYEPVELRTQPGDLFYNYEIKNWDLSPRLYKILGISAVANILALIVIGSSGLLTARGCDSPFVGRVCQVLDTVYVGSLIFGTDREYVDAPYEKTDLGDAEITFVNVTGVDPPLTYPAGYFQLANPEQQFSNVTDPMATPPGFIAPGIPYSNPTINGGGLINTPQIKPNDNPNAVVGDLPTGSPLGNDPTENPTLGPRNRQGGKFGKGGTGANTDDVAKASPSPSPSVDPTQPYQEKVVNSRPFKDLATEVNVMRDKKELNLDAEFSVTAKGKLTKEGKLDEKTFKFVTAASSDPKMVDVVKRSIEAFNDSGMLQYLEDLSGKDLNLAIAQDKENVTGEVRSQVERETRAQGLATALRLGIQFAIGEKEKKIQALQAENNPEKAQSLQNTMDELELLKQTEVVAEGKDIVVKFKSPKTAIHNLIIRKLDAQAMEIKKESGTNQPGLSDNSAKK